MRSTSSLMLDTLVVLGAAVCSKAAVDELSIRRFSDWLEEHDYRGYDTFDGLNARFVRPLMFNSAAASHQSFFMSTAVPTESATAFRRSHLSDRPKECGFLARGFIRLEQGDRRTPPK